MSAAIMDGETQNSAVSSILNENPVLVAQKLMQYDDRVLEGVERQTLPENGFGSFSTEIPQRRAEYEAKLNSLGTGTVGCVALDQNGK
jgi:L-asparaginase